MGLRLHRDVGEPSVDIEAASRLLSGTTFNAALWVAASDEPNITLPKAILAFRTTAEGFLADAGPEPG